MIELKKIQKYFSSNGVMALNRADFDLREGEIHVLLGENGAGKSTLMHIMAGFMKPGGEGFRGNPGSIHINGKEQRFSSPADSLAAGIGMVRQHPHVIPGFLVWENCIIGSKKNPPLWINRGFLRKQISVLNDRFCFSLPLDSPVETLSVSQRQQAAILGLLLRNTQYLIFDEPAAVLSLEETENLFGVFSVLRDEGKGIVLISHKLEEATNIADRITVLRQGKTQISCKAFEVSNKELYDLIFGPELNELPLPSAISFILTAQPKKPVLTLEKFRVTIPGHPLIRGIDLNIQQGTIMGIAGVRESGLETLELSLTGFLPFSGVLRINGKRLAGAGKSAAKRIRNFRAAGGSYLGQRNEDLFLSIRDLLLIHAHRRFQKHGILNQKEAGKWVESVMDASKVPRRKNAAASALSGGQLQRLLLTREMAERSSLLVLSAPGGGLDLRYRKRLAVLLRERAAANTAVVVFSADTEELMELSDSIAVLRDGLISKVVEVTDSNKQKAKEMIQEAMVGHT